MRAAILAAVLALGACASMIDSEAQCRGMMADSMSTAAREGREHVSADAFMARCVPMIADMNRQIDINARDNFLAGVSAGANRGYQRSMAYPRYPYPPPYYPYWRRY